MALFEVFIPSNDPDGFNITTRIRADSWIQALRNGLSKLGDAAEVKNIMVDIKETGIDVTEPQSGRVFRITEIHEDAAAAPPPAAAAPPPAATAPPPAAAAPPPAAAAPPPAAAAPPPAAAAPPPVAAEAPPVAAAPPPAAAAPPVKPAPVASAPPATAPAPAPIAPAPEAGVTLPDTAPARFAGDTGEEVHFVERPATEAPSDVIGRGKAEEGRAIEDILGELFELTQEIYDHAALDDAAAFILDLAMKSVPSESGAVFISDISANVLTFAAARGPKAGEVMKFKVPVGKGIVGFCAQEGVSLAVSDVHRDPHFFASISKNLGYETKSILCAPAQQDGRVFGALELINKTGGTSFTTDEVNVLNYLAHELVDYMITTGQTGD